MSGVGGVGGSGVGAFTAGGGGGVGVFSWSHTRSAHVRKVSINNIDVNC